MPYVVVSTQIRVESGPTVVGDEQSDPELMQYLGAQLTSQLGNDFKEYRSSDPPRVLLDKLELRGYKVIAMAGIGQTCIWTLNKPPEFS
ncbi:GTP cyclohydrolase 1 feedback regulatory protein [Nephila pilipes]|uniref:GTP cyclohydrolase 1 feedback regulatory protein n=1 Tax=Nephila pilipes TaxID=299642 RepID=A0A8X6TBF6_NEPPI|nr:GTP cyclohydrolase 1 feedback regulatory protein [Nephila pilipes]